MDEEYDFGKKSVEAISESNVIKLAMDHAVLMIDAMDDDEVFKRSLYFYRSFSPDVFFGAAFLIREGEEFELYGRYGIPNPDSLEFCEALSAPILDNYCDYYAYIRTVSVGNDIVFEKFDKKFQKSFIGINIMPVALRPSNDELNGMLILYKKAEQEFGKLEKRVAEYMGNQIALAVQRNG